MGYIERSVKREELEKVVVCDFCGKEMLPWGYGRLDYIKCSLCEKYACRDCGREFTVNDHEEYPGRVSVCKDHNVPEITDRIIKYGNDVDSEYSRHDKTLNKIEEDWNAFKKTVVK